MNFRDTRRGPSTTSHNPDQLIQIQNVKRTATGIRRHTATVRS